MQVVAHYSKNNIQETALSAHLISAIQGFFRSIALAPAQSSLQDTLRLLTLWFRHGNHKEVESALREGFNTVSIDTWLQVKFILHLTNYFANIRLGNSTNNRQNSFPKTGSSQTYSRTINKCRKRTPSSPRLFSHRCFQISKCTSATSGCTFHYG